MLSDFLKSVIRWNVERNGTSRLLPYLYYDNAWIAGVYTASTSKVKKLIPTSELFPIEVIPGRCLVAFAFFDYKETDQGPYKETSISFFVQYKKRPIPTVTALRMLRTRIYPSYVWQLPVTTDFHCAGGVDLYGYPKFVADIEMVTSTNRIDCSLSISGNLIVGMTGRVLATKAGEKSRFATYTVNGGHLICTSVIVDPIEYGESRRKKDLTLEIGENHTICETLKEINLSSYALIYQYSPRGESILFPGRNAMEI